MKNSLRFFSVIMIVIIMSSMLYATGNVTFLVNMKIQLRELKFNPSLGDSVYVHGDFNGWGPGIAMTSPNGDSIYQATFPGVTEGAMNYKFQKTLRAGTDWENIAGGGNRPFTVVAGNDTTPLVWFSDDSVYVPPVNVQLSFICNMKVAIEKGNFRPDLGDVVHALGSMNGWSTSAGAMSDLYNDSNYVYIDSTDGITEGSQVQYKFYKTLRNGKDWEDGGNDVYNVPFVTNPSTPPHWFNFDSIYYPPLPPTTILFQSNMNPYEQLGFFRPDLNDTLELRGGINSWGGGTIMQENLFTPGVFEVALPYSGNVHDIIPYKARIKYDSTRAAAAFPGYGADQDNVSYEHPVETGDGNRLFDVGNGGNVSTGAIGFSSIDSCGEIPAGDSVTVTVRVNMKPAITQLGFNPATDTVQFFFNDAMQRRNQVHIQGTFTNPLNMTMPNNDTIYYATFTMVGPAHYNIQYFYTVKFGSGGGSVSEGGGFGNFRYRSRTIAPLAPAVPPRYFTLRLDTWIGAAVELPAESPSCPSTAFSYGVLDGWNMVSLPITVTNYALSNLYPTAQSVAFYYNAGYVTTSTLSNGPGYWIKFSGAQTVPMAGVFYTAIDIPVALGWNMIGSVTDPVTVSTITSTPSGIVNSNYFGYSGGYNVATSIQPGAGYWVRVSAPGTLHLLSSGAAKQSPVVDPLTKLNKLTIQDQKGHQQVLYFGSTGIVDVSKYAMPPVPPQGAFDARFAGNQQVVLVDQGKTGTFPLQISSATGTVKISWKLSSASTSPSLVIGTKQIDMSKSGSVTVSGDVKLVLNGTLNTSLLPKEYALSQNYPNPFNPTTTLQYQLPADSRVTVKIYDILGNEVRTLVDENQDAGYKSVVWNATNNNGTAVASGIYFVRISAVNGSDLSKTFVDTKKMMLMK